MAVDKQLIPYPGIEAWMP